MGGGQGGKRLVRGYGGQKQESKGMKTECGNLLIIVSRLVFRDDENKAAYLSPSRPRTAIPSLVLIGCCRDLSRLLDTIVMFLGTEWGADQVRLPFHHISCDLTSLAVVVALSSL